MSSSLQRSRYVSWCVDSVDSPTPVTTATEEISHLNHQTAGSGSVPPLLLSPPETSGRETNATFYRQRLQLTKMTHQVVFTQSYHSQSNPHPSSDLHNRAPNIHADEGEDDDNENRKKGNFRAPEADNCSREDLSLLHPEDESFLLLRSSPVISRHRRPLSWHGVGTDASAPSSLDCPSPASGSLSLDQHSCLTVTSMDDLGFKEYSCHHSSQLQEDKFAGLHLPTSGQQGLAEEHRRRGLTSCNSPHASGLCTSAQDRKERRCSGIPEFSADTFKTSCELEKENAHFIVVDMVLEVLEGVKCTLSFDRCTSTMDKHQHTCKMYMHRYASSAEGIPTHEHKHRCKACRHTQTCSGRQPKQENNKCRHLDENMKISHRNTYSPNTHTHQQTQDEEEEEAGSDKAEHQPKIFSVLSTDSGFKDCGVDMTLTPICSLRNVEWLAMQLVQEFRRSWLPSYKPRHGQQSLCSSLQELPGTEGVVVSSGSLTEEIKLKTRMRGSLSWAPPCFQIIFTVQSTHRRSEVVALQHFLCAGCGTEVEPKYIKKLRYCEYLGKYFCDCCHSGSEAVIPGRILSCWDFSRYPVSDFSKQLLDSVWHQPLFDVTCVAKTLHSRVKELNKFREFQNQLLGIKKLLTACRLSGRVMTEFEQLPAHLMEQPHLFSMDDLLRIKKGQLVVQARALLHSAINHVKNCKLCLAQGFICEFCQERDIIFPFQSDICQRCPVCRACFHKHCFVEKKCPKCALIQSQKKHPDQSMKCDV